MARTTITTEADKADFFRRLAATYENGAAKQVKSTEREKLASRADAARTHAETCR
jgi:hypothetical protein